MSRFTAALAAEWRKLTSTALWWVLALGMAAYLAFVGAAMAFSLTVAPEGQAPPLGGLDAALTVYGVLNAVGYVFPLVVGTLLVTTEVRHKTLTQTLLAEPRRGVVLGAKLVLAAGIGLLYGVAGVVGLVAAGAPVLSAVGDGAFLGDPQVVRALLLGVLVTGLWAVLGTGFGLGAVDGLSVVSAYLPGAAADAVVGASLVSQMGDVDLLPAWAGALVLLGYAAALTFAGRLTTFARDVV